MPNRSGNTRGREGRRCRLWLRPETWAEVDQAATQLYWDNRAATVIERWIESFVVERRELRRQLALKDRSSTGPVELEAAK